MADRLRTAQNRLSAVASTLTGGLLGSATPQFPAFDDLPKVEGQPQGCTWGLFDKNALNLLTPAVVQTAAREIQSGIHVQLDWPLHNVRFPGFERKTFAHRTIDLLPSIGARVMDDELHINTQSGSQWDSLKHFAHQASGMYYNGLTHDEAVCSERNGIHNWCERGGIVGRGVLVDYVRWWEETRTKGGGEVVPSPLSRHEIGVEEVEEVLRWQGTSTRVGDVLLVRTGFVRWHDNASPEERKYGTQEAGTGMGLQASEKTVRWLYDRHFAAVAGDSVTFEAWPPKFEDGWCLHEWLLAQWGTPIGEMWDLEKLSKMCVEKKRWTFFLTSAPLHVRGGVGSPPGVIAVF